MGLWQINHFIDLANLRTRTFKRLQIPTFHPPYFDPAYPLPQRDIYLYHTVGIPYNISILFIIKVKKIEKKYLTSGAFLTIKVDKLLDY